MTKLHTHCKLGLIGAAMVAGSTNASAEIESLLGGLEGFGGLSGISGEVFAAYDTKYFYRGLFFGDDNLSTGVEFSANLCENVTATIGGYYLDVVADQDVPASDDPFRYSESGISGALSWDSGIGVFDLGFTHFQFYDGFDGNGEGQRDATEVSLTYSTNEFYGVSAYLQGVYDFRIDAVYLEAGFSTSYDLTSFASLELSTAVGYSVDDYYTGDSRDEGITHILAKAALPIALLDNVTLTPHVSINFSGDARETSNVSLGQNENQIFGGVNLAVSF